MKNLAFLLLGLLVCAGCEGSIKYESKPVEKVDQTSRDITDEIATDYRAVPSDVIAWPEENLTEADWKRIADRSPPSEEINPYVAIETLPKIEDQAEFGKKHPHVTIEGHKIDYDAEANWYFYSGTNQRAVWLEASLADGSVYRNLGRNAKTIWGESYEFDPGEKVWRKQAEQAPPPPDVVDEK